MNTIGIICSLIGAIATVLAGVWFIVQRTFNAGKSSNRLDAVERAMTALPCTRHSEQISQHKHLEQDVAAIQTAVTALNIDMASVKSVLAQNFPSATGIFMSNKNSPRVLNETGQWVLEQINGAQFLSDHKDIFFSDIDRQKPKTALDVETAAVFACHAHTGEDMFNAIKIFIYNAPALTVKNAEGREVTHELTLGDVCYALSIPLRDQYLETHPEILR